MIPYKDLSGESNVAEFDVTVSVKFKGTKRVYRYSRTSVGDAKLIAKMIELADAGKGLQAFINQHVRDKFEKSDNGNAQEKRA